MPKVERFLTKAHDVWMRSVLRVGNARGFVIETQDGWPQRLVVTAAHCLTAPARAQSTDRPQLPTPHSGSSMEERLYPELLGRLGAESEGPGRMLVCRPCS